MKKISIIFALSLFCSISIQAENTCIQDFNDSWNNAWNLFDLDKYDCLVDPFAAPYNCEEVALDNRIERENNAIITFNGCCTADPNC